MSKPKDPVGLERYYELRRIASAKWRVRNLEKTHASSLKHRLARRWSALNAYGGRCACCGEERFEFLTFDHIDNDGADMRRKLRLKSGFATVRWLAANNYPDGFQVLCYNCNCAKGFHGKCPHQIAQKTEVSANG